MIRKITYLFICLTILSFCGCKKSKCFKSTGKEVEYEQELGYFNELELYDKINIILFQDTIEKAIIRGGANLVSFVSLQINDGRLIVKDDNKCNYLRTYKRQLEVEIHYTDLNYIYYESSGIVSTKNAIQANILKIESVDGSQELNLEIEVDSLELQFGVGPGDINLSGYSNYSYCFLAGNGMINCANLDSKRFYVNNSGTGDITINASEAIGVELYHLGDVKYLGNPIIEYEKVTGKGEFGKK